MSESPTPLPEDASSTPPEPPASSWRGKLRRLVIAAVVVAIISIFIWALLPPINMVSSGRRVDCGRHLRQLTMALHLYETNCGSFPPAYTVDANGNRLHSWRTLILPYLEHKNLYDQLDLDEPWDAQVNQKAVPFTPEVFQCPDHPDYGKKPFTSYVAVVGPNTMWPGEQGRKVSEVSDNLSQTIFLVEISRSDIHWTEPRDLTIDEVIAAHRAGKLTGISSYHSHPRLSFADGSVRSIDPATLTEAELRALFNVNDGTRVARP